MSDATYLNLDYRFDKEGLWGFPDLSNSNMDFYYPQPDGDSELIEKLGFIPGLKEFLILRQVHALEHATVWMLSNLDDVNRNKKLLDFSVQDNETIGGAIYRSRFLSLW